jgi:hypothetical protein
MLRKQLIFILVALFATSCTTMQQPTAHDELYAPQETSKVYATGAEQGRINPQVATNQELMGEVESILESNEQVDTTLIENQQVSQNPYDAILVDDMGEARERRLEGIANPWYRVAGYYNVRNSDALWYASAYDPAFYTVVVMGDDVWVEPNYIAASFGYRNSIWGNSWYSGFGFPHYNPYAWSFSPHYSYYSGYLSGFYHGYYGNYYPYQWPDRLRNYKGQSGQRRVSRDVFIGGSRQTAMDVRSRDVGVPENGIVVERPGYSRTATNIEGRTVKRQDGSGERIYVRPQSENTRRAVSRTGRSSYRTGTTSRGSIDRSRTVNRYQRPASKARSIEVQRPEYVRQQVNRSSYSDKRRSSVGTSTRRSSSSSSSSRSSSSSSSSGSSSRRSVGGGKR